MLPEANDLEPKRCKNKIVVTVPLNVTGDFRVPIFHVLFREFEMYRTSMPEATVNEHHQFHSSETNIRFTGQLGIYPVSSRSHPLKLFPEKHFRASILAFDASHYP